MKLEYRELLAALGVLIFVSNAGAQEPTESESVNVTGDSVESSPGRLIEVAPVYPPQAAAAGVEGFVDVSFTVTSNGTVSDPRVVAAEPAGVFDAAALTAVSRWRYAPQTAGGEQTLTERIAFSLDRSLLSLTPRAAGANAGRRARNACVREQTRYDFGAAVDVSLFNACSEPLMVFSCASGTGAYRERWICRDPEASGTLLGASASAAQSAAMVETATGLREFSAGRNLELTRAPNGEYWWLACALDDVACRDAGRLWVRSVDGQVASVNPQDRTRARLARSF